jgi:hypothetical protein
MQFMNWALNIGDTKLVSLLGQETEIELRDGEVLQGVPMEITYPRATSAHLLFEAAHGEYLCLDLNEIRSVRQFQPASLVGSYFPAF